MDERGRKSNGELRDAATQWQRRPTGRARLTHLAQQLRATLDRDGLGSASLQAVRETCGAESAPSLMAEFIWHVDRLDADPIAFAERCGQIMATLRERHGVDPETDETLAGLTMRGRSNLLSGRKGHEQAYGTAEDRAVRDARLVREFDYCREQGAGKENAYRAVARANNCSDRLVRDAVKSRN